MAEKNSCNLAISLALASLTNNGDLAKRLADLSEQMTQQSLYEEGLRQGADLGIEGDAKQLANEYSLKQESTQIKFKSVLFGGLLANTAQGDDAIRQLMSAIKETGGTVAEALDLLDIMSRLDLTGLEDIAKIIGGTVEEATTITEGIRKKIAYYTGSNYSIVTSGSQVKAEKVQKQLSKQMKEAEDLIKEAERTLGNKTYKSVNKDLNKLKNGARDNKRFWSTKEGRSVVNRMADKYGQPHNKEKLQNYLQKISDAQKTLQEQQNVLDVLGKELSDALNGDLKIIEDGQNPYLYVGADGEWKFNKTYNKDISKRVLDYGQYVLARTLLTDTGTIPQSVYDILIKTLKQSTKKGVTNYLNEDLTEDWILDEDRTLDELLSRAYTNTQDLVSNGQLRNTYRQRLISLASDGDLTSKDVEYIESLFSTMRFAGDGAGFSDVFKYTTLLDNAEELGVKVPKKNGKGLRDGIVDFFQDENFDALLTQQTITLKNGTELTQRQLLELVSGMVNDINITKLIMSNDYTDSAILDIAGKYLIGDKNLGNKRLLALITSVKKAPTTDDTRGVILKAITGKDIPEGTKVGFFDFRSMLEAADDVKARAEFRDRLADANKINLPSNTIENITERSLNGLIKKLETYKGGVILVNDSQWKMNSILSQALYEVNRGITNEADKITVAFPKGGLMGKLSWENGKMVFKTSYSESFNNFLRRVSIRTLGESNADTSITKELADLVRRGDSQAIAEMNKILEEDARKYFGAMIGEDPYSERLPAILEDMTGISFKNYDAVVDKADFWKRVDDRFMIGLKTVGKYDQEVTTVADVIKQVDNMSNAQIASDLSNKFGYPISEESITENGKIKEDIKNAYLNYQLSQTPIELLENKGRLLAVINGGVADNISIDQFKGMLLSNDYSAYKDIFFHNVDLSDEELAKHVKSINSMIMDGLSAQVADNLVAMGYSLPLVNVRDLVYDYLTDRLNANSGFANAFLYKNNLPPTLSTLQGIVNEAMPSELRFGYDDGFKYEVVNHGSNAYHVEFSTDFIGSGESGAAHGAGIYVTKENPERSTGYALKSHKPATYMGKERKDIVQDNDMLTDIGVGYSPLNIIMDRLSMGMPFSKAVDTAERSIIHSLEEAEFLNRFTDESENIEKLNKQLDYIHKLKAEDFSSTGLDLERRNIKGTTYPTYKGLNADEYEQLANVYFEKGQYFMAYRAHALSSWLTKLYGGEVGVRGVPVWSRDSFGGIKKDILKNFDNFVKANEDLLPQSGRNKLRDELSKLDVNDFELPGLGQYGYFYKLEIPDYIRQGADTPTGRNYLDMHEAVYINGDFVDREAIEDIESALMDFSFQKGIETDLRAGDLINRIEYIAKNQKEHKKLHTFKDFPAGTIDEEDLYDIVAGVLKYDKKAASEFFSSLGYKGLHYTGGLDGECYVIYDGRDVKTLAIYDNRYKTPIREADGLDKEKYKVIKEVYEKAHTNRDKIDKLVEDVIDNRGLSMTDVDKYEVINLIDDTISDFLTRKTAFKTLDEMIKYTLGWSSKQATDLQKVVYGVFSELKKERNDVVLNITTDELDELSNFTSPSLFEVIGGRSWGVASGELTTFDKALLIRSFVGDRSVEELAKAYGLPIKVVDSLITPNGLDALGRFGFDGITLARTLRESTAPHELFHGIFRAVDKDTRIEILNRAQELYGMSLGEAEEMLAEKFSEYFRTGKFTLPKEQKTFKSQIEKFFSRVKDWILGVERYQKEVGVLFDDMLNLRYAQDTSTLAPDYITRYVEVENQFLSDTYSSLTALAAIKDGVRLPNVGHERQILKNILDEYYATLREATKNGKTLKFSEAQKLKVKAGYALDMYEQDYLLSRYRQFLTPDERSELFGLKYGLGVTTNSQGLEDVAEYNNRIMDRYDNATKRIINQNDIIASSMSKTSKSVSEEIQKRQQELMEQGATMKVVDGQVIVVDTREELYNQLRNIPSSVNGLGVLKSLGRNGLNQLSNEQAYFLLNVVELARNADNKMNMITQTIYKLKPQLARLDFFRNFKAIDGLPSILRNNLLTGTDYLASFNNTATFDDLVKRNIFSEIKDAFLKNGHLGYKSGRRTVSPIEHLQEIIDNAISINVHELGNSIKGSDLRRFRQEAATLYQSAFTPYTILENVPKVVESSIDEILEIQQNGIREAMRLLGDDDRLSELIDAVSIQLDDGSVKTLRQILDGDKNNINKTIFDTELDVIKTADENASQTVNPSWSEAKRSAVEAENKKIVEATENNYMDGLRAYLNESEIVSQGERDLLKRARSSARELAKQYTLTNKLADTDNALAGINEEIVRGFKADILGFKGLLTRGGQSRLLSGTAAGNIQEQIMQRWSNVKDRYRTLYSMTPEQLAAFEPKNAIDTIASNLAKYFKEIEGRLGSIDGVTGATTSAEVNKAFAHIGEVVMNIDSIEGLYSIMSGIEGNQLLKFFRFSNVGDLSRVDKLVIGGLGEEGFGGYRNYVNKTDSGLDREWFNRTFASNFSDKEYNKMIQALCGFTIVSRSNKRLQGILNFVNSSNYFTRVLMSYPGQLVTIGQQSIAYFLKQIGRERNLGIEDLGAIDAIRTQAGILNGAYNELNIGDNLKRIFSATSPDDVNPASFYNRYGLPDVSELMRDQKFYTSDDLATMYSKIDNYGAQGKGGDFWSKFLRNTDAYKDNANNIIDGLFARNFKNIAFVKALQTNNYMTFATAEQFANFMASDAPETMKRRLMSTIMEASGRNFRNILGLGFSGLDRAVGGSAIRNVFIGLMQMFNFRGAWGQNIARQTSNWIMTGINMSRRGLSKEGRDAIAEYIAKQPEFVNFSKQLFNDLQNMWHLTRFQDNGDWMPEDEHSMLDFIEYAYEVMQFSSQRWQGIQSYGTARLGIEAGESIVQSMVNPEVYKDTYGVGALMNAISKNLGRNWKVRNLGIKTIAQMTTNGGWDAGMEYLSNEFWKLSFGTLRYLMNEDETSYGYSTELIGGRPGAIPFIITGETSEDGDKAYSYDLSSAETWLNITNWYDAVQRGDAGEARTYYINNLDSFLNASQLGGFIKNSIKALRPYLGDTMQKALSDGTLLTGRVYAMSTPRELAEAGDAIAQTAAGQALFTDGYYVPAAEADIKILVDEVLKQRSHRPGNDGFNKSMFNFDKSGHMASLESSNVNDASMEMLLENIKYERDDNFRFITNEKGQRKVTDYWQTHMNDLNRRINDEDYLTTSNFNFINGWVEANNDDPNYMLYKRLIGEGLAGRYMSEKVSEYIDGYNKINGLKKDMKLTKQELTDASGDYQLYSYLKSIQSDITGERRSFLESIVMLDKAASMDASIKMIARQLGDSGQSEELEKIFKINDDGEVSLSSRYQAYIEEQAKLSRYLNEGDLESFVAETASITKLYQKDDPYGIATTALISSRINRINQAENLSPEQKAKAINVLMTDNYEFIQEHIPEFIDELGSAAKEYIDQMNNSLYDVSLIGDDLARLSEMNNSKSGRSNGISISNKAKNLLGKLGSSNGGGDGVGGSRHKYNYNFVPVKFDGAKLLKATGSRGYSPRTASIAIDSYKPHSDFSISKDTKRKIKTTTTQTVSSKKQLSNIEKKTQKALEAES